MDTNLVEKYISSLKNKSGLTLEAIAKKCDKPESTIKKLCSGDTEDPRLDTVAPVIYALGGSLDEMYTGKSRDEVKEISITSIKEIYEQQLSEMTKINEKHINNIRAHYEQHRHDSMENYEKRLADKRELIEQKDEYIKTLKKEKLITTILALVCVGILVALLIAEVMNPNLGWIQF